MLCKITRDIQYGDIIIVYQGRFFS